MSLVSLPPELILDIKALLEQRDEFSLRITCQKFYTIIPPPKRIRVLDLLCFRSRLLRPGNLFSSINVSNCGQCQRIFRDSSKFPFGDKLQVNDYKVCDDCFSDLLLRGGLRSKYLKYQYKESVFYCCYVCHESRAMVRFLLHPSEFDGERFPFCSNECHMKHCNDAGCDWI